jgi:hypothetical protein
VTFRRDRFRRCDDVALIQDELQNVASIY